MSKPELTPRQDSCTLHSMLNDQAWTCLPYALYHEILIRAIRLSHKAALL